MEELKDKVAVITGGSSGIGKATAIAFAEKKAKVAILSIQPEEGMQTVDEIKALGGDAIFINTDVTHSGQLKMAIDTVFNGWGRLDFAFNNAGINGEVAKTTDYTEKGWDTIININLKGVWLSMKYEIPHMLKSGGGVIVNTSSMGGLVSFPLDIAPYIASKHGVLGLTKAVAREYAEQNIRVNAVCPGAVRTPLNQNIPDEITQPIIDGHLMKRWGKPEEIAGTVLFLCSDMASFITGASLTVDGGYTAQ